MYVSNHTILDLTLDQIEVSSLECREPLSSALYTYAASSGEAVEHLCEMDLEIDSVAES